jgi:hypothetical protein
MGRLKIYDASHGGKGSLFNIAFKWRQSLTTIDWDKTLESHIGFNSI